MVADELSDGKGTNRLAGELSPYLLMHGRNPVDWYPWGPEAFEKARREDRPVFLSIGYSSCHWCHVMEQESFSRPEVAELLNREFVSVKVDREERPDLDAVYMLATQLTAGRGGWPNSVWLRPDGRPWFAGTYFPREDRGGLPGFRTVLAALAAAWRDRREEVDLQAERLWRATAEAAAGGEYAGASGEISRRTVDAAVATLERDFDAGHGGFGGAPKFPPHAALRLLLYEGRHGRGGRATEMAVRTLDAMAAGGLRDHLGGGFHRYSTDDRWFAPHFEKMLYDNAQLVRAYADGFLVTGEERYRRVAIETCDWMLRELADPNGGFRSALDADSEGQEGRYYVWTEPEIREALGTDAELLCRAYGVEPGGNWTDEATGRAAGANILHRPPPPAGAARSFDPEAEGLEPRLAAARARLLAVRNGRVPPGCDDKVVAGWNGLAVGALARAGTALGEERLLRAAERAAVGLVDALRGDGVLPRYWRQGRPRGKGFLEDHVLAAGGLLDLHEAAGGEHWLGAARELAARVIRQHRAEAGGFRSASAEHDGPDMPIREAFDGALPSPNGAAAQLLLRLAALTGEERYRQEALRTMAAFGKLVEQAPAATLDLALAAAMHLDEDRGAPSRIAGA